MALRYKLMYEKKYGPKGQEKVTMIQIGAIMDGKDGGFVMKLEMMPTGWTGWAILEAAGQQRQAPPPPQKNDGFDDDIPF
jgi:hypothetical protein